MLSLMWLSIVLCCSSNNSSSCVGKLILENELGSIEPPTAAATSSNLHMFTHHNKAYKQKQNKNSTGTLVKTVTELRLIQKRKIINHLSLAIYNAQTTKLRLPKITNKDQIYTNSLKHCHLPGNETI